MTDQEFAKRQDELLKQIPYEFRSGVSFKAYQDGHAYGNEEILNHLEELVALIATPLRNYENRVLSDLEQSLKNAYDRGWE